MGIFLITDCQLPELVGDGFCHDYTNNRHCAFDRGDCCGSCVNTDNCIKCQCKTGKTSAITNALVGDGYCHDYLNNVTCNFDGGDCCGGCANTDHCLNCVCHAGSPILTYLLNCTGKSLSEALIFASTNPQYH